MSAQVKQARSLSDTAVELAESGLWVFPCHASKRPVTKNGFKDAENDPEKVRALFEAHNGSLIGVATGSKSGIFVLDLDLYKGDDAIAYMKNLQSQDLLPPTRVHKTKQGGLHYFYSSDSVYPNVVPSDGVDVKGDGGYVIWWPEFGGEVVSTGIAKAPEALINKLTKRQTDSAGDSIEALRAKILRAEVFHDALARLAARYVGTGVSAGETVRLLIEALRGSVASSPHHARHDRWRQLLADEGGEISRIVLTANKKYSASGATDDLADALGEQIKAVSSKLFVTYVPNDRDTKEGIERMLSGDAWPFQDEGYFAHENHEILKQRFIMHPILCEGESVLIAAEPKTGKTAVSLTVGLHIACGLDLGEGLKVAEPRSVLYFGLEGRRAIKLRIAAWRKWQAERDVALPESIPLFVVEAGQNLMDTEARLHLVAKVAAAEAYFIKHGLPSLGAIFIDTFTKSMAGGDQNSVEDTSKVFDVVGMMRDNGVTAAIAFIHHKARAGNVRGSSNIEADPDCLTSIEKDGHQVKWRVDRARSVEEGGAYNFMLHNYDLGLSEQGYMINAPVVEAMDFTVDDSDSMSSAKVINSTMHGIIGLGDGVFPLQRVIDALAALGLGPQSPVAKAKVKATSAVAQKFFTDLIPETGYAFGQKTVVRQMSGNLIDSLHVR